MNVWGEAVEVRVWGWGLLHSSLKVEIGKSFAFGLQLRMDPFRG